MQTKNVSAVKRPKTYRILSAKQFARLKPSTQRVKIAEDVLAVLAVKRTRYRVAKGDYFNAWNIANNSKTQALDSGAQLQSVLPSIQSDCKVCAIGALFISHVRINNSITLEEAAETGYVDEGFQVDDSLMFDLMGDYFPAEQLRSIEYAFEGYDGDYYEIYGKWLHKYPDAVARLRAICRNIIRNKGDFNIKEVRAR